MRKKAVISGDGGAGAGVRGSKLSRESSSLSLFHFGFSASSKSETATANKRLTTASTCSTTTSSTTSSSSACTSDNLSTKDKNETLIEQIKMAQKANMATESYVAEFFKSSRNRPPTQSQPQPQPQQQQQSSAANVVKRKAAPAVCDEASSPTHRRGRSKMTFQVRLSQEPIH